MKVRWLIMACVVAVLTLLPGLVAPTQAAPSAAPDALFTVNTTSDTVDVSPGNGVCADSLGNCSLRAAVMEANALSGADEITLPTGTYLLTLTGAGENAAATGDLDVISGALTITGAGSGVCGSAGVTCIDGNNTDRVFHVQNTGGLVLNNATVTHGHAQNSYGGGIAAHGLSVTLVVSNCLITANTTGTGTGTDQIGGGIDVVNATATINRSTIANNVAWTNGGGLSNYDGVVTVSDSTLSGNNGYPGGGIVNQRVSRTTYMTITRSAIISNTTDNLGGGIANGDQLLLTDVTLAGNTAATYGGAIADLNAAAATTLAFVTVAGNTSGGGSGALDILNSTLTLRNTIVAANTGGNFAIAGTLVSGGYNLSDSAIPSAVGTDIQNSATVNLLALGNYGGPSMTMALNTGSAAIEKIANGTNGCASGVTVDQRGAVRADGTDRGETACDIGAYEYHSDQKPTAVTLRDLSASASGDWNSAGLLALLGVMGLGVWLRARRRTHAAH